jgi:diguanylate cyclase (GGDEF)-like protein
MKTSGKITALFVAVTSLLCALAAGLVAVREFRLNVEQLVGVSSARALGRGDLNYHTYRANAGELQRVLGDFLADDAIAAAYVLDVEGEVLAGERRGGSAAARPSLGLLRGDHPATETVLVTVAGAGRDEGVSFWGSLFDQETPLHLTLPLISTTHPGARDLSPEDFAREVADPRGGPSQHVLGFVHLVVDRAALVAETEGLLYGFLSLCFLAIAACGIGVFLLSRRITAPMMQLSRLADEVASGTYEGRIALEERGDFGEIAVALNTIVDGFTRQQQEIQVDRRLLSMKVEERSSQLSDLDRELSQATEEVTHTRDQLERLANYDALTSLPNRRLFTEQLELLLRVNERNRQLLGLLFIDLNNFRRVNASLGHSAGDQLLREVGRRLVAAVRQSDAVAHYESVEPGIEVSRLGGDEFTVVLNQLEEHESAGQVAERLIAVLREPMTIQGQEVVISPSIGIAVAPSDAETVEGLLTAAGIAMHHAKSSSRFSYLYYRDDMERSRSDHLRLENDLRKALEQDELVLHYQPVVDTLNGAVIGAEALLRWEHPQHGQIPPQRFIALAEETGIMGKLGEWVVVEACRQLAEIRKAGLKLPRVCVNVSYRQLNGVFVARVAESLEASGLEPGSLELGVSAAGWCASDLEATGVLRELKAMGVYLSVDDLGVAQTPLSCLERFPLDAIKIDRSFVVDCHNRDGSGRLVAAMIAMARTLELEVIAEGVESPEQFQRLTAWGARLIQGYLFGEPVPLEQLRPMLAPWHFVETIQSLSSVDAA